MDGRRRERHGVITRLYLELTGYPQVGGVAILSYQLDLAARAVCVDATGRYSAVRYRDVMTRCASDVTGEPSLLHHVACRENAAASACTSPVAGS